MLRDGPFPGFLHGLVEYVAGALFIALPLLLDYESGAATAASIIIGVGLITVAATTDWGLSLVNKIPKAAHVVLDFGLAALLIASPFIFGFSSESAPTAIFIAAGVLHVLLTIGTRFVKDDAPARHDKSRGGARRRATTTGDAGAIDDRPVADAGMADERQPTAPAQEQPTAPEGSRQRFARESGGSERITTAVSEEQAAAGRTGDRATARRDR